jgi:type VI secretion system protein ImpF
MPEPTQERILPCLLDRLTDESPDSRLEGRADRVISVQRYRAGVLRDLAWLLNAKAHLDDEAFSQMEEVRRSVVNYGIRDLCGQETSNLDPIELERDLLDAIKTFEPRIMPDTLEVKALPASDHASPNVLAFEIRGQLWAKPLPEQLYIKTEIDLETGQCKF